MPRLVWSNNSLRDLDRLRGFLAEKSRSAARRAVKAIRMGVNPLARDPEIGRLIEDMPPDYREWIVEFGRGAYVVLYQVIGNEVVIISIRHGREDGY
jgi:plasmid stabilization system protein ParE